MRPSLLLLLQLVDRLQLADLFLLRLDEVADGQVPLVVLRHLLLLHLVFSFQPGHDLPLRSQIAFDLVDLALQVGDVLLEPLDLLAHVGQLLLGRDLFPLLVHLGLDLVQSALGLLHLRFVFVVHDHLLILFDLVDFGLEEVIDEEVDAAVYFLDLGSRLHDLGMLVELRGGHHFLG